ncbi:SH3 domain-containing protein [Sphingomonas sp. HITSZ_GF]|uniref:SH3 domain-containing protein n=1 Tax=Sphingomonas sp. HITSZ_GF TaxID=3037247 RepID=UPI00321FEB77
MPRAIKTQVPLHASPQPDSDVLIELKQGEIFEVLELAGDHAWGVAPAHQLVGYLPASVLERPAA